MREFLSLLINPVPILYILLFAGFIFITLKKKRIGKVFLAIAGFWFIIISTPFFPKVLIRSLESKYSQLSDSSIKSIGENCDIIVLGGGHTDDKNLTPNNQLSFTALSRLAEGIRIQRIIPGSRLILSGYSGRSGISQALVLYQTALILGIDSASMAMQISPSNTRMEAEEYVKNAGINNSLILVTSAVHMPRAVMHFRKAGISPIAAPAAFRIKYGSHKYPWRWVPSSDNIGMMEEVIHEYTGIAWAYLGGK